MDNSSKDVDVKDLVTREALNTNGPFFFTGDDVKVPLPLGKPSIDIGKPFHLELEIQRLALDVPTR